jgi:hypothetical protein
VAASNSSPTVQPLPGLNDHNPYFLFEGESGIWLSNPDGILLTGLPDREAGPADPRRALSPDRRSPAFIAACEPRPQLKLLNLPAGPARQSPDLYLSQQSNLMPIFPVLKP